jgi:hypothetical protein
MICKISLLSCKYSLHTPLAFLRSTMDSSLALFLLGQFQIRFDRLPHCIHRLNLLLQCEDPRWFVVWWGLLNLLCQIHFYLINICQFDLVLNLLAFMCLLSIMGTQLGVSDHFRSCNRVLTMLFDRLNRVHRIF